MAYLHLAAERAWPRFVFSGLSVDASGQIQLAPLADPSRAVSSPIPPVSGLDGPVGIAVDSEGNVYASDPAGHRILRLDGCGGESVALPCIQGPGNRPGQVHTPRGLTVDEAGRLWVADSKNKRLQAWDLASGQVIGVWSGPWSTGADRPVTLHEPWDLASDSLGNIYVADPGMLLASGARRNGRVLRFSPAGKIDIGFIQRMEASGPVPESPTSVAIVVGGVDDDAGDRLLVLDREPRRLLAYRLDGRFDPAVTQIWTGIAGDLPDAQSVSFLENRLYLGTPGSGTLAFNLEGRLIGRVGSAQSSGAGIAIDCEGRLLVHPGGGGSIMRAQGAPTFNACGTFLAGPFGTAGVPTHWQRVRMDLGIPSGAHIRVYTLTSDTLDGSTPANAPAEIDCTIGGGAVIKLADGHEWTAAPLDAGDFYVGSKPGSFLWIAGVLRGDRRSTPNVRQIRVDHDRDGWISWLPAIYRRDPSTRTTVDRFLALYETIHDDVRKAIEDLPVLFDPQAAHDEPGGDEWLDWLATWVGVTLGEAWTEDQRRSVVAGAFRMQARRGTLGYLRHMIWLHAGVRARIIEGTASSDVWVLGLSPLGSETRPTAYPAQGAVLGSTASVDRSYMKGSGRYGAELFDDAVHCLFVHVYRADLRDPGVLARVRAVLDDEVPAHMVYRLCVIEPKMRVGHQASVGVDAILGGPPRPVVAEGGNVLGSSFVLPEPRSRPHTVAGPPQVGTRIS